MKKVLLITEKLEHYRISLFSLLAKNVDLTIIHASFFIENMEFKQKKLIIKNIGPFVKYSGFNAGDYDFIIYPFNMRVINLLICSLKKTMYKKCLFGIGLSASYDKQYDQKSVLDYLRIYYLKKFDYAIFYEKYPFIKYKSRGVAAEKMSIAYNTVSKNRDFNILNKTFESFLFIGSLYKQKNIFSLIEVYHSLYLLDSNIYKLEIVGEGDEFHRIEKYIYDNKLVGKIILHGKIISDDELLPIMQRSIVCISPGQAGLSVQKCFSYGVGFITTYNAITGGEIASIIENVNGDFYDGSNEGLSKLMLKYLDLEYARKISNNAYIFYNQFRSEETWVNGFIKNIN